MLLVLILGGVWFFRDRLPGSAADLAVGNCFDEPVATDDITDVQRQPCNEPHDAEIVAVVGYDGETYPIQMQIERFVSERCVPAFESYTGRPVQDETEYDVGAFYPARSSWNDGDREVTCYAYRVDGEKLTDSIRSN